MTSLPNELLVAIAAAGQEGRFLHSNTAFDFKFKSEWTFSHLCRCFREAIIGTPELWTHVEVDLSMRGSVEIFNLYLERCGTYPISATLQYLTASNYHLVDERLRGGLVLALFRDVAAPNLRHLEIINALRESYYWWPSVEVFSSGAPRLAFLKMDGFRPQRPAPPWTSLTHLELRKGPDRANYAATLLFEVTKQCPLLVHLSIEINWEFTSGLRFCIPSLKFLHISLLDHPPGLYLLGMVDLFDTPALTKLTVSGANCYQIWELLSYGLDCTSFPVLTSFSSVNSGPCCRTDDPIPGPKSPQPGQFTALTSITLINQCLSASFVRGISDPLSQLWPRLKTVTLCPQNGTLDAVQTAIRDAVELHQQEGQPLPKFRLSPELFALTQDWDTDVEMEVFDPIEIVKSLR
ncbi:hypothetical protein B0H13DRAFT_2357323 [Mycena leptocephala]|nr:hypothetical protein B0H13DRAFT_2357323 [Mycena leptocephala]